MAVTAHNPVTWNTVRAERAALAATVSPKTVRAELVEALPFLSAPEEGQGFDRLSPNGVSGVKLSFRSTPSAGGSPGL
jgi:hypothetical protein